MPSPFVAPISTARSTSLTLPRAQAVKAEEARQAVKKASSTARP